MLVAPTPSSDRERAGLSITTSQLQRLFSSRANTRSQSLQHLTSFTEHSLSLTLLSRCGFSYLMSFNTLWDPCRFLLCFCAVCF